jgi:hypothetical protein
MAILVRGATVTGPWLCMGDFNIIAKVEEKLHRSKTSAQDMTDFQFCLLQWAWWTFHIKVVCIHGAIDKMRIA